MKDIRSSKELASIAEARCHYLLKGYRTVDSNLDSCIMSKYNADDVKVGEVIINREGFLHIVAEEIQKSV